MTAFLSVLVVLGLFAGLWLLKSRFVGLRSQSPEDFAGKGPLFDPRLHLNGAIQCEGVLYGPLGRVTSRFTAEMLGTWDGNRGVLSERFQYDDGSVQMREWRLLVGHDGALRAEADDVEGAGRGQISGPSVQMLYQLRLPAEAGGHVLRVVDWMYLMDNGTIMNRSQFRKFGITVAELVATMRRVQA